MKGNTDIRSIPIAGLSVSGLIFCLASGWLICAGIATGQTPETAPTAQQEAPDETTDDTVVEDSGTDTCPGCGRGQANGRGRGGDHRATGRGHRCQGCGFGGHGRGHQAQMRGPSRPEAQVIHFLIDNHERLDRTVEEIPGGVRTRTLTQDPEIVDALRTHVRQMVELLHGGGRIRNWDPLFREIFDRRDAIQMEITDIEGGVEVTETSDDPEITKLIRAHAAKVEQFVERGREAYREDTPLPADYSDTSP